jgi:hypothetical protein
MCTRGLTLPDYIFIVFSMFVPIWAIITECSKTFL